MTKAEIGKNFLVNHSDTYRLEIFNGNDNVPYLNICRLENVMTKENELTCDIVHEHLINMTDIFEQVADHFNILQ